MAGKVNVPISVAVQGVAKTQAQLNQLSQGVSSVGRTAGIAAVAFAAFAAGIKSADFAVSAIAGARDLERNIAGLSTVFDEQTARMKQFAVDAQQMGLSLVEASKSATFIGSVLKQSGFTIDETADLTERLVGLATDLSITYGYDVQEALLGMTALFRGEYDPIEKFGVAMKQNEINAELAARGLNNLEGAERRLAEQQIRVQFLFERSADAAGALERQSGTLAVEQLRLQASFANMRDTVAKTLLPVIADMMKGLGDVIEAVGPELRTAFFKAGPVIKEFAREAIPLVQDLAVALVEGLASLMDFLRYIQDNWDWLSVLATTAGTAAVSIGLMTTAINVATAAQTVLNATVAKNPYVLAATALIAMAGGMQAVTSQVEETDPYLEELHGRANSFANDLDKSMSPGLYAAAAETERFANYLDFLRGRILEVQKTYTNTTSLSGILAASGLTMADFAPEVVSETTDPVQQGKNYVKDFFDGIADEMAKQEARIRLEGMGASEGLINAILGTQDWEEVFDNIIAGGKRQLESLQDDFNATAAGIAELNKLQEEANQLLADQEEAARQATEALAEQQKAYEELVKSLQSFNDSISDTIVLSILPTIAEEVGQFQAAVVTAFDDIQTSLKDALDNGQIFQMAYNQLVAFANAERGALEDIARQRDELAKKGDWVENLVRQYRDAFTSALQLTSLLNGLEEKTREVTITEVTTGIGKVGDSVKDLRFELTKTYTETITETIDKTAELTNHFRDVAARATAFAKNLKTLKDMGLDPMLFNQLVEAGVEAGGETAQALIDGGSETINEINGLFKDISDAGVSVADYVGEDFYGIGEDFGSQLLDGIRSQQAQFEETARQMAQAFQDNFNADVQTATGQVAQVASLEAAIGPLEAERDRILGRLAEQEAILTGGTAGPGARAWAIRKTDSYTEQLATVEAELGRINDAIMTIPISPLATGGVALGAALAMIGEGGPEAVIPLDRLDAMIAGGQQAQPGNVYNIYVTADTRVGGAKAGEAIVQQLRQYEDKNGAIGSVLKVN